MDLNHASLDSSNIVGAAPRPPASRLIWAELAARFAAVHGLRESLVRESGGMAPHGSFDAASARQIAGFAGSNEVYHDVNPVALADINSGDAIGCTSPELLSPAPEG